MEPGEAKRTRGAHAAYLGGGRRVGRRAGGRRRAAGGPRRGSGVGLGPGLGLLDEVLQGHVQAARHGPGWLEGNRPYGGGGDVAVLLPAAADVCGGWVRVTGEVASLPHGVEGVFGHVPLQKPLQNPKNF